ncbi:MAG: Uma2 family endonuclease [Bacteroidetes bacterium]|nr:Uma2 family endonuclease [Fibrella sp.]
MTSSDEKPVSAPRPVLSPDERRQRQRERERLLARLVYETDAAGKPIYYADYQQVLTKNAEPESIMGSSALQSYLVNIMQAFLYDHPLRKHFFYLASELGVQIGRKKWRSCDIAIYERERLKDYTFTNKYMSLPPDFVIEIDTKADLTKYTYQHDYFLEKTRQLHEFGVKKVVWIFTENHPVIWESDSADTITIHQSWDVAITITEGMIFNLTRLIEVDKNNEVA